MSGSKTSFNFTVNQVGDKLNVKAVDDKDDHMMVLQVRTRVFEKFEDSVTQSNIYTRLITNCVWSYNTCLTIFH